MVKVNKPNNLWLTFFGVWFFSEILGFGLKMVHPHILEFLQSPIWDGWISGLAYCILWIYAGISWLLLWILWPSYIYGGIFLAILVVYQPWRNRRISQEKTLKRMVIYNAKRMAKTFKEQQGFGKLELDGLLMAVHVAVSGGINTKSIEMWILEGIAQGNSQQVQNICENTLSIEYPTSDGEYPQLFIDGIICAVH